MSSHYLEEIVFNILVEFEKILELVADFENVKKTLKDI